MYGSCCAPNFGGSTFFTTSGDIMSSYGFQSGWCSWANQCGGSLLGTVYWLDHQSCDFSPSKTYCATPGSDGGCMAPDALWNVHYTEYYLATWDCNGTTPLATYYGPGCIYH
jgi:hypothetical protein